VTISARPSAAPAAGVAPDATIAWKAINSVSKASAIEVHTSSFRPSPSGDVIPQGRGAVQQIWGGELQLHGDPLVDTRISSRYAAYSGR
jgi:hypothetical protein